MFGGDGDAESVAKQIAAWLADANTHKTHGRPITVTTAQAKGLKVERLEDDQNLQDLVLSVHHSVMVTFLVTTCVKIIENHQGKGLFTQAQVIRQ